MSSDFYNISILPYTGIIIKLCRAYTNSQEDFEDYYQEVCLQIWRSKDNFKEQSLWSTWVYRISLNVCLTLLKKDKKKGHQFTSDALPNELTEDNFAFSDENLNELYRAIRQLSEIDRGVILLYLEEKSYKEIAEIMGTTANNIGLIYALSPIFVIIFARIWYAEQLNKRQILGVISAFGGVIVIVAKGDFSVIQEMRFTTGDLWILAATASWGFYSLWQGHLKSELSLYLRFAAMSIGGVIALAPFAMMEIYQQPAVLTSDPFLRDFFVTIAFLAIVSSIIAYSAYAYIIKILGASKASLVMYAIPLYNAAMAWAFLNEQLEVFHLIGAAFILPGLFLAVSKRKTKS